MKQLKWWQPSVQVQNFETTTSLRCLWVSHWPHGTKENWTGIFTEAVTCEMHWRCDIVDTTFASTVVCVPRNDFVLLPRTFCFVQRNYILVVQEARKRWARSMKMIYCINRLLIVFYFHRKACMYLYFNTNQTPQTPWLDGIPCDKEWNGSLCSQDIS